MGRQGRVGGQTSEGGGWRVADGREGECQGRSGEGGSGGRVREGRQRGSAAAAAAGTRSRARSESPRPWAGRARPLRSGRHASALINNLDRRVFLASIQLTRGHRLGALEERLGEWGLFAEIRVLSPGCRSRQNDGRGSRGDGGKGDMSRGRTVGRGRRGQTLGGEQLRVERGMACKERERERAAQGDR